MNIGSIGHDRQSEIFLQAVKLDANSRVVGVYAPDPELGEDLALISQADYYTDSASQLFYDPQIDFIYVGCPMAERADYVEQALRAGKHILCQPPMTTSIQRWHELHDLAVRMECFIFDVMPMIYQRNYQRLREFIRAKLDEREQPFLGGVVNASEYDPDYLTYLHPLQDHVLPVRFDQTLGGGALIQTGIYPFYLVLDLFGSPASAQYQPVRGWDGLDVMGAYQLNYGDAIFSGQLSLASHSKLHSELYIDDEAIAIDDLAHCARVDLWNQQGQEVTLMNHREDNLYQSLLREVHQLIHSDELIDQFKYEGLKQLSLQVCQLLAQLQDPH